MTRFLIGRLLRLVVTLALASFLIYGALELAPGSPLSVLTGGRTLPPGQVAEIKSFYHLNQPFLARYGAWVWDVLHGHLGTSLASHSPVATVVAQRLPTTLVLVVYASLLTTVLGVGAGVLAATRGRAVDSATVLGSSVLAATPQFVAAVLLVAAFSVALPWFPVFGSGSGLFDRLWHLTLPAFALSLAMVGYCARVTRTAVLDERGREHVDAARSRGLPEGRITRRHVVRNALVPTTTAVGLSIAGLIAGSVVVEQAFGLDGLGSLLIQSVQVHDFAVVQAVSLILVAAFMVVNTAVDAIYPLLDPRIGLGTHT